MLRRKQMVVRGFSSTAIAYVAAGIVGLPNVGKSALFNALAATNVPSANFPFCTIDPHTGVVPVPDKNLTVISRYFKAKRLVPASVTFIDIAGIIAGASKGEGLGNKFLQNIRETDAVLHCVRCFDGGEVTHVEGSVDPVRDAAIINSELLLADMQSMEGILQRAKKKQTGSIDALKKVMVALEEGKPARSLKFANDMDAAAVRQCQLLTSKPMMYVANVGEVGSKEDQDRVDQLKEVAAEEGASVVTVSAKLEEELGSLEEEDKKEFMAELGIETSALEVVTQEAYKVLGLQSYYTAGDVEVRAWRIPANCKAVNAAGVIHSDIQKGFIKAEVYSVDDLVEAGGELEVKKAGRLRIEGPEYKMQLGDIVKFNFR